MRKPLAVVLTAVAGLAIAAAAAAYTAPKPSHSLLVCYRWANGHPGYAIGGAGDNNGTITAGKALYLRIGWGTATRQQDVDFLNAEEGSITIRDAGGNPVSSLSWPQGSTKYWTSPTLVDISQPNGGSLPVWQTFLYAPMGSFSSGSYTVDVNLKIDADVYDGAYWYGPDYPGTTPWFAYTGCPMTVT